MSLFLKTVNCLFLVLLGGAYLYQLIYLVFGLTHKRIFAEPEAQTNHRYAAVISARNEEAVIGDLIASLRAQQYPSGLLDIFVVADNCTDDTAAVAARAGASVFRRFDSEHVGKGYALDYLFRRLMAQRQDYAGYFIFDADNLVDPHFVAEMNKTYNRGGYDAITCYRSSRNFGANWISAGYSIWFLRQARFMNFPRSLLGVSCSVGGTGFFVSDRVIRENDGWPFHLLTEDIEFSADCAARGRTIGYCDRAVVFDEQPVSFLQSWDQRLRWSKGFYQVNARYISPLLRGMLRGGMDGLSCYDMLLSISPCGVIIAAALAANLIGLARALLHPMLSPGDAGGEILFALAMLAAAYYIGMLLCGIITVASEWRRIPASTVQKLRYLWAFPLFMLTYLPIAVTALVRKTVEWKPIRHGLAQEEVRREPLLVRNRK